MKLVDCPVELSYPFLSPVLYKGQLCNFLYKLFKLTIGINLNFKILRYHWHYTINLV
jgi:hypothetical protein